MFQTGRGSTPAAQPSPVPRVALKAWPKPAPEPQGWTGPSSRPEASVPGLAPRRCQLGRKRSAVGETQPPGRAASCFMGVQSTRGEVQRPDWRTEHVWWSLSSCPAPLSWLRWMAAARDETGKWEVRGPWHQTSFGLLPEGVSGSWCLSVTPIGSAPIRVTPPRAITSPQRPLPGPSAGPGGGSSLS